MSFINLIKSHYSNIPSWMLTIAGNIYYMLPSRIRYGSTYKNTKDNIKRIETFSKEEIAQQVDKKFVEVVNHAYNHVPFYKRYYDEKKVDISSIKGVKDITKLPFIDKDVVRKFGMELIADDVNKDELIYVTTSGSTGNPVGFYQPSEITMIEWAYTTNIWSRVGYNDNSKRLVLRGKKLHPGCKGKSYYYDPLRRELSCNIFDMRNETMKEYCDAINKYKPDFIHGYMSAIMMLAKYIDTNKIKLHNEFKAILATSENVIASQKEYVELVFGTRVFSFYGHSERLIIAGECEKSTDYHVEPLYGYCEIIDGDDKISDVGQIVATGFLNYAMPLIRYKTGDEGSWSNKEKCDCELNYQRIEKVTGRWHQDMLVNNEGACISLTALNIHTTEFDHIVRYKFVQLEKGIVTMLLQVSENFKNEDITRIKEVLQEKTNNKIIFEISVVESIPVLPNGKYQIVEQHLEIMGD